jgi:hypothetical protein
MFLYEDVFANPEAALDGKKSHAYGTSKLRVPNFLSAVRLSPQQTKSKQSRTAKHG